MNKNNPPSVDQKAINSQLRANWFRTFLGLATLAALGGTTFVLLGLNITVATVIVGLFTVVLPLFSWYNSAKLVKRLMKCEAPNTLNPDHRRLVRLVKEIYPKTGLKKMPEVLVSPIPMPNAFATGRNPNNSFIACTEGLFSVDLSDEELKAVLAHELAHVKSRDVAITSLTATMGSLFSILLAGGMPWIFSAAFVKNNDDLLVDKLSDKVKKGKKNFAAPAVGIAGFFFTLIVFAVVSFFTKFVTFFVSRSRESAADALAAQWTGNPCALATALQKINDWVSRNRLLLQLKIMMGGLAPMLFFGLHEDEDHDPQTVGGKIGRWWREIGENHPPIPTRIKELEAMAGASCPTMDDIRKQRSAAINRLFRNGRRTNEE
ncbi:zinc metalloprotease HtpX [soil metagenome]